MGINTSISRSMHIGMRSDVDTWIYAIYIYVYTDMYRYVNVYLYGYIAV